MAFTRIMEDVDKNCLQKTTCSTQWVY